MYGLVRPDTSFVFVKIGLGFHAEMTLDEAVAFVDKMEVHLNSYVRMNRQLQRCDLSFPFYSHSSSVQLSNSSVQNTDLVSSPMGRILSCGWYSKADKFTNKANEVQLQIHAFQDTLQQLMQLPTIETMIEHPPKKRQF